MKKENKKERYTITATMRGGEFSFTVMAHHHRQHIWHSTVLCGVSKTSANKMCKLIEEGFTLSLKDSHYNPTVIGWEI